MAEREMPKSSITQYNNSYAAREKVTEENQLPQAEKVVTGRVISAKKTPGQRFKETFFNGDDAKTVGSAIFTDVVVPAIKETLFRSIQDAMSMFLWGDTRVGYRGTKNDYTPYNSIYSSTRNNKSRDTLVSNRLNDRADYTNLIFESRLDADDILYRLRDCINTYPSVTVMYLYDLIGKRTTPQDDKWGWTDLSGARVRQIRGGYLLELPPPIYLD